MDDIYWQIYSQLESEMNEIMFTVSFNKKQKYVYSPRIAELIVRAGMQIESIAKEVGAKGDSNGTVNFKTSIEKLNKEWLLHEKFVSVLTNKIEASGSSKLYLKPFDGMVDKISYCGEDVLYASKKSPNTFSNNVAVKDRCKAFLWENAYNNLKHNFYNTIDKCGNVYNLIHIMSALYLLNLYFDPNLSVRGELGWYESSKNNISKSNVFSIFIANCFIDDSCFVIDDMPGIISFDNCVFLRLKTIESYEKEVFDRYGDNWEVVRDYTTYEIPEYLFAISSGINPIKNYELIIRNCFKQSDFKITKSQK